MWAWGHYSRVVFVSGLTGYLKICANSVVNLSDEKVVRNGWWVFQCKMNQIWAESSQRIQSLRMNEFAFGQSDSGQARAVDFEIWHLEWKKIVHWNLFTLIQVNPIIVIIRLLWFISLVPFTKKLLSKTHWFILPFGWRDQKYKRY